MCIEIADTGLLFCFPGTGNGENVLLRCELDALAIEEINDFQYKSQQPGVSHKCGHDGHMAILFGVGKYLQSSETKGDAYLLFQPAEENGMGAKKVLDDPAFEKNCQPNYVFALHNIPGSPMHSVLVKSGPFTPSVISAEIELNGKTAHAAEPQNGVNPSYAFGELLEASRRLVNSDSQSANFKIITPIYATIGSRDFGISAGNAKAGFTLRTGRNDVMEQFKSDFTSLIESICDKHQLTYKLNWTQAFSSIENDPQCADLISQVAEDLALELIEIHNAFPWGEDFGLFTERYSGAMFGLGSGINTPALHNPDYDFPDELIETGVNMFVGLIHKAQNV